MSAQDYYGSSRQNSHTPNKRSSKQYLGAPLVDQAGYFPERDPERPRSAMGYGSSSGYGHSRSRSADPSGQQGERGLVSTIGGGAAGGYAGKKFLGGKLGAVAGALGGAVVANKIEHKISGHHHSSSYSGSHYGHHGQHDTTEVSRCRHHT
ncbi:Uncharacterized protein CTRI78_v007950 [Colletotrichum trifolii]|uniref:Glycine zipper 2TM domain-containing protein n=1 Tax=Colletotrichum trifolii TaxID=5466 RepID=A0A4R8R5Z4_COLTR|nr:Uncharacterized protein CTRI78_v007950 [Colletotrichum trifolii]